MQGRCLSQVQSFPAFAVEGDLAPLPQGGLTTKPGVATNGSAPWDWAPTVRRSLKGFHSASDSHFLPGQISSPTLFDPFRVGANEGPPTQGALPAVATLGCDVMPFQGNNLCR